jgi:hypothetical protein
VYYGARGLCVRGSPGWRWLDLRALAADLVGSRASWADAAGAESSHSRSALPDCRADVLRRSRNLLTSGPFMPARRATLNWLIALPGVTERDDILCILNVPCAQVAD